MIQYYSKHFSYVTHLLFSALTLNPEEWREVRAIVRSLEPTYNLGKILQSENLPPGKFFSVWQSACLKLATQGTVLAHCLELEMKSRGAILFESDIMLAGKFLLFTLNSLKASRATVKLNQWFYIFLGIYIDPNYRLALTAEQQRTARAKLIQTSIQLESLKNVESVVVEIEEDPSVIPVSNIDYNTCSQDLFASSSPDTSACESSATSSVPNQYEQLLDERQRYSGTNAEVRLRSAVCHSVGVMTSHQRSATPSLNAIKNYPANIRESALALFSLPPTQVSVERLFSSLKFIERDNRSCISPDLLEAILFQKMNGYKL